MVIWCTTAPSPTKAMGLTSGLRLPSTAASSVTQSRNWLKMITRVSCCSSLNLVHW